MLLLQKIIDKLGIASAFIEKIIDRQELLPALRKIIDKFGITNVFTNKSEN